MGQWANGRPLDIGSAGVLLRSPFLNGATGERTARALLDVKLRDENVLEVSLARVRAEGPAILAEAAGRGLTQLAAQPRRQSPGVWARAIPDLLKAAGWPGDRTQSSPERHHPATQIELREGWIPGG